MVRNMLILLIFILSLTNCHRNPVSIQKSDFSPSFQSVWDDFDANYSYFIHKQVNWDSIKTVYEPLVQNPVTYDFFTGDVLRNMLSELRDLHVNLFDKDGSRIPLYTREITDNYQYNSQFYNKYISNRGFTSHDIIAYGSIGNSIGYILITSWSGDDSDDIEEFLTLFDNYRSFYENYEGIIIDVRPNSGGSDGLAKRVASRFTTQKKLMNM